MKKKYSEIVREVESSVKKQLRENGVTIKSLDDSLAELKKHTENIEEVEESIAAIREEVMIPIQEEMEKSKKAGQFSIWGFYLGIFGLGVSILSICLTLYGFWDSYSSSAYVFEKKIKVKDTFVSPRANVSIGLIEILPDSRVKLNVSMPGQGTIEKVEKIGKSWSFSHNGHNYILLIKSVLQEEEEVEIVLNEN